TCGFDRLRQNMACIGSRLDWVDVLAENGYFDSLGHSLQVSELWCNSNGHSTVSRNLISDFREFNAPLARGFDVGLEIHKYQWGSNWFDLTQLRCFLGKAISSPGEVFKLGNQFLVSQERRDPL